MIELKTIRSETSKMAIRRRRQVPVSIIEEQRYILNGTVTMGLNIKIDGYIAA